MHQKVIKRTNLMHISQSLFSQIHQICLVYNFFWVHFLQFFWQIWNQHEIPHFLVPFRIKKTQGLCSSFSIKKSQIRCTLMCIHVIYTFNNLCLYSRGTWTTDKGEEIQVAIKEFHHRDDFINSDYSEDSRYKKWLHKC